MKNFFIFNFLVIALALLLVAPALQADAKPTESFLYVQSIQAKLVDSPGFKSKTIAKMRKGDRVQVIKQTGNWINVEFNNSTGWLNKLVLSSKPPINKQSVLREAVSNPKNKARRRASSTTTAAATRGLRADSQTQIAEDTLFNYEALEQMEAGIISDAELQEFINQKNQPNTP